MPSNQGHCFFETEFELRTEDNTITVAGLAVPYGKAFRVNHVLDEELVPGVFGDSVKNTKIGLHTQHNHRAGPFARTGSGTLELDDRPDGLYFRAKLDTRDPAVQSLAIQLERKDIDGISPGFYWKKSDTVLSRRSDRRIHRLIKKAGLFEISLTHKPTYTDTYAELRSEDLAGLDPVIIPVFPAHLSLNPF